MSANDDDTNPIFDLLMSHTASSTLIIFGRLGLFDYIHSKGDGGASVEDVSTQAKWSVRATSAMMISLAAAGILCNAGEEQETTVHSFDHEYKLSASAARFLRSENVGAITPYFELFWDFTPQHLMAKSMAEHNKEHYMLETGGGAPSQMFIDAMEGQTSYAAMTLSPLLNLNDTTHFVDVAGGSGVFCIDACKAFPEMKGSIYELDGVCPIAEKYIAKANLSDRVKAVPGNMFKDEVFPVADCYAFGNILHDWSDEDNKKLLEKAYRSLPASGGKVAILEMLISEEIGSTSLAAAGLNLHMVTNEDGRQYKASELKEMLQGAGFADVQVVSSPLTPYSVVMAEKR